LHSEINQTKENKTIEIKKSPSFQSKEKNQRGGGGGVKVLK
jgi:hypothetical protein